MGVCRSHAHGQLTKFLHALNCVIDVLGIRKLEVFFALLIGTMAVSFVYNFVIS